ncbi:MAG: hypothetical protein SFY92_06430 [Verrucomicrobiae bacterium]|nr:hypothetical protein [Verrucomicrobiae bacterium]
MSVAALLPCPKCHRDLPLSWINAGQVAPCPHCRVRIGVEGFPSLLAPPQVARTGLRVMSAGEATCYFHAQKQAQAPCDFCGRFLCALCAVEFNGQVICAPCLESGQKKQKIKSLQNKRYLYDNMALMLSILPWALLVFWFLTLITAPIALFMCFYYWNTPSSLIPRSKVRLIIAGILSLIQIGLWTWLFLHLFLKT